jgi:uncharacterized protein
VLAPERAARLEQALAAFERETSHQVAVLTVPSLEGEAIESFSMRVAEAWKLGQRGRDDGVLILVAPNDRRARIEVGYGLEGVLPDAVASRILRQRMTPRFAAGDFAGGIEAGAEAVMAAARGEAVPLERRPARDGAPHEDPLSAVLLAAMAALFVSAPLRRARPLGALAGGGVGAALTWLLLASAGWAALGFAIGALLGALGPVGFGGRGLGRGGRGAVFGPGGFGGRGGGFGGGFGGGGGGFGGGGASGSW